MPKKNGDEGGDSARSKRSHYSICRIIEVAPNGYLVYFPAYKLTTVLRTRASLPVGGEISAPFVLLKCGGALLSARFSKPAGTSNVRWEEHLDKIDAAHTPRQQPT